MEHTHQRCNNFEGTQPDFHDPQIPPGPPTAPLPTQTLPAPVLEAADRQTVAAVARAFLSRQEPKPRRLLVRISGRQGQGSGAGDSCCISRIQICSLEEGQGQEGEQEQVSGETLAAFSNLPEIQKIVVGREQKAPGRARCQRQLSVCRTLSLCYLPGQTRPFRSAQKPPCSSQESPLPQSDLGVSGAQDTNFTRLAGLDYFLHRSEAAARAGELAARQQAILHQEYLELSLQKETQLRRLESSNLEFSAQVAALDKDLKLARKRCQHLEQQLEDSQRLLSTTSKQLQAVAEEKAGLLAQLDSLTQSGRVLRKELDNRESELAELRGRIGMEKIVSTPVLANSPKPEGLSLTHRDIELAVSKVLSQKLLGHGLHGEHLSQRKLAPKLAQQPRSELRTSKSSEGRAGRGLEGSRSRDQSLLSGLSRKSYLQVGFVRKQIPQGLLLDYLQSTGASPF